VTKKFTDHAEIVSKGKTITRNGDDENPAYKVERPGKNPVLKKVGDSVTCGTREFNLVGRRLLG
jgi:hypothetical protein